MYDGDNGNNKLHLINYCYLFVKLDFTGAMTLGLLFGRFPLLGKALASK